LVIPARDRLGLGLLTKYAMGYFVLGGILAALFRPPSGTTAGQSKLWWGCWRRALLAPNIVWNIDHTSRR